MDWGAPPTNKTDNQNHIYGLVMGRVVGQTISTNIHVMFTLFLYVGEDNEFHIIVTVPHPHIFSNGGVPLTDPKCGSKERPRRAN